MFDGSSISGWKGINESDMILMPDDSTAVLDPFTDDPTVILRCDIVEPDTMQGYERDPRSIAKKAEAYWSRPAWATRPSFGPEPEFFVFDDVKWSVDMSGASYSINAEEAAWSSNLDFEDGNTGHRPRVKGGYFPVPPVDSLHDIRAAMCSAMAQMGFDVEVHHHEVGTAGQCEIGIKFNTLVSKRTKYRFSSTASSMWHMPMARPQRLCPSPSSVITVRACTVTNRSPKAEKIPSPETAMQAYPIRALITSAASLSMPRHSMPSPTPRPTATSAWYPALKPRSCWRTPRAIAQPLSVSLTSHRQKASALRCDSPTRLPTPISPLQRLLMAGLDGIQNKIHPGDAADKDLYDLPPEEAANIPTVASSLEMALDALDADRGFLTAGGVFSDDMIDAYIELKREEVERLNMTTHPANSICTTPCKGDAASDRHNPKARPVRAFDSLSTAQTITHQSGAN